MRQFVSHVSTDYAAFAVTLVVVLFVTFVYLYIIDKKKNKLSCPGVEPSNSETGNLDDIQKAGSLHDYVNGLHKQFGPIVSFWLGKQLIVSLASPDVFKDVATLFNRPDILFAMFKPLIGDNSIQFANDGRGRKMRQVLDRSFSHSAVSSYTSVFNEVADEVVKEWSSFCTSDEHIAVKQYMFAATLKAIMLTSFGDYFKSHKKIVEFEESYDICWTEMEAQLTKGLPDEKRKKKFDDAMKKIKKIVSEVIAQRRNEKDKKSKSFLDTFLENDDLFMTEDEIFDNTITYIFGGFHTTGNLLTWAVYYLCLHPEYQEKVFAEINRFFKDDDVFTMEDMKEMHYTRQVLDETLRASVLAPYAARYSDYDILVDGHLIPAKTPLLISLGTVLKDPEVWPEPERFDPERFNPDQTKSRDNMSFVPFGFAGKRNCPGYHFAYFAATAILVKILKSFKLELVQGTKVTAQYQLVGTQDSEVWITCQKRT